MMGKKLEKIEKIGINFFFFLVWGEGGGMCPKQHQNTLNKPLDINISSNHPPKIVKNLPENIQKRISKLSRSSRIFNNSKG